MSSKWDENRQLLACESPEARRRLLAELFSKHRERLKRMVEVRMDARLRRRVDASDVIQETFLEAVGRVDAFLERPEVPLFIWARFLVGQKLQDLHRRHLGAQMRDAKREVAVYRGAIPGASSEALAAQLLGQETSPSLEAIRAERRAYLEQALDSMSPLDREILALRHYEELTSGEAAQVLGIKEPTARQRYFRALERLKSILICMPGWTEERQHERERPGRDGG